MVVNGTIGSNKQVGAHLIRTYTYKRLVFIQYEINKVFSLDCVQPLQC
jgi:hypothetical protein